MTDFGGLNLRDGIARQQRRIFRKAVDLVAVDGGRVPAVGSSGQQRVVSAGVGRGDPTRDPGFDALGHLADNAPGGGNGKLQTGAGSERRRSRCEDRAHEPQLSANLGCIVVDVQRGSGDENGIECAQVVGTELVRVVVGGGDDRDLGVGT